MCFIYIYVAYIYICDIYMYVYIYDIYMCLGYAVRNVVIRDSNNTDDGVVYFCNSITKIYMFTEVH